MGSHSELLKVVQEENNTNEGSSLISKAESDTESWIFLRTKSHKHSRIINLKNCGQCMPEIFVGEQ